MDLKHPYFYNPLASVNVKSTFAILTSISVLLRMSTTAIVTNTSNSDGEQLKSNLVNYQCFTDRGKLKSFLIIIIKICLKITI